MLLPSISTSQSHKREPESLISSSTIVMYVGKAAALVALTVSLATVSLVCGEEIPRHHEDKTENTPHKPGQEKPRWEKLIYQKEPKTLLEKLNSNIAHIHEHPHQKPHKVHPPNWERAQRFRRLAMLQERYRGHLTFPFGHVQKPRPRFFLEVITIRERVVVDEHNKPKGFFATVQNSMFASTGVGKLRKMFQSTLTIRPKRPLPHNFGHHPRDARLMATAHAPIHGQHRYEAVEGDWFDRMIEKFHLDQFWPRLAASIILGFFSTLLIFGLAKLIQFFFFNPTDGYAGVPEGDKIDEGDELIKSERKRASTVKAVSVV